MLIERKGARGMESERESKRWLHPASFVKSSQSDLLRASDLQNRPYIDGIETHYRPLGQKGIKSGQVWRGDQPLWHSQLARHPSCTDK